ncbi:MAG TPA: glycerophosphodiester phosphodiesterase family protein [Bosea sp. (in: a-proteobacteria)]|jgi:glycerophosphoryl diester phosphodiesterase|uniref:glycerophosphodiester phosphodiesterase n=1 Tax=Bosea sp. (in: a-proteobacteria) TaxID=1871050 RepID=UPI002E128A76|nr:glycerophosphodiester phosphodiesterase family protein [Bosea sp. (in: a-proteobacteria)]
MTRPLVIAHRGHSARHPENTLEAYRAAIASGADLVETDARLSADGVVVASHDPDLARTAGSSASVADTSYEALKSLARSGGVQLATLAEALAAICPHRPALIDIKTKDLAIIDAVLGVIRELDVLDRVWIGAREVLQVAHATLKAPGIRVLAFLPDGANPEHYACAGASAFRIWEGALDGPVAARLLGRQPVWVTAGGAGTGRIVGDVDGDSLRGILAHAPQAVLLNDPDLLIGLQSRKAS